MPEFVAIETFGAQLVARELELTGARGGNMRGAWPFVIKRMERAMEEAFQTRGQSENNYWPDLKLQYAFEKFRRGENLNILRATDEMYEALTGKDHSYATHHSPDGQDDDYLAFGASDLPQFRFQQGRTKRANFPERKPVKFRPRTTNEIAQLMLEWTLGQRNKAGRKIDPVTSQFVKE